MITEPKVSIVYISIQNCLQVGTHTHTQHASQNKLNLYLFTKYILKPTYQNLNLAKP